MYVKCWQQYERWLFLTGDPHSLNLTSIYPYNSLQAYAIYRSFSWRFFFFAYPISLHIPLQTISLFAQPIFMVSRKTLPFSHS